MSTDADHAGRYRAGALLGGIAIGILLWWGYAAVAAGWGILLLAAGPALGARYDPRAGGPDPAHATASARAVEAVGIAALLGLPALVALDIAGAYDPGALLTHAGYGAGILFGAYGLARLRERVRDRRG